MPPPPPAPPPPPPFPLPDTSLVRAVRRTAARSTISAGVVAGVISAALVTAGAAVVAILWWAAHLADDCSAQAAVAAGDCHAAGANGYLTSLSAVLWQSHGSGEVMALYVAGRITVRMLFLRSPGDAALRSAVIAVTHTSLMMIIGAAVTARGDGLAIGPHYGLLLLWGLGLGFVAAYAGILRRTFPQVPRRALVDRVTSTAGPAAPFLAAALAGIALALALSTLAGVIAMATHLDQTADAIRSVVGAMTTKPWPNGGLGTFAAIVLLVLAAPTWAVWVLAYSLVIPTVSSGGFGDFGLTVGDHDAYFWVAVLIPIVSTLLTGYAAARLRRAGSVEGAVLSGAGAGLVWAAILWIIVALLDGVVSIGGRATGGAFASLGFGPALGNTLGALLLWGLVGGVVGAYLSLLTVGRPSQLPVLRRYSAAVVGPPLVIAVRHCPACALQVEVDAAFCSRCGTALSAEAAEAAAQRLAILETAPPPEPPPPPPPV
jgi:predicted nucleic acid-binding Zn ribbon protein